MGQPDSSSGLAGRAGARVKTGLGHFWKLLSNGVQDFFSHHGTQLAASMAYYALFSIFPTAIVLAAVTGLVLDDPGSREDVVQFLLEELPLTEGQGRSDIEAVLDGVTTNSGTLGLIGAVALLISASALISAARNSVNIIFEQEQNRGAVRGKALDVLLVLGLGVIFAASFAITLIGQLDITLAGAVGEAIESFIDATGLVLPILLTAFVFGVMYRVLPARRPSLGDIWPGVAFGAITYELLKRGFSFYLENIANYSAVYGSLGAVIAFMFFVFLASIVFLIGAEMAALWPRVRSGELDPDPDEPSEPFSVQLRRTLAGLFRSGRAEDR